ncbi:anti-sigma factor [Pedobacter psychrotolerans]|uniref:anti-sigma factor family protein n=1 Tax=Pedobacter psychrotolerans TaxID=1843235 RepID=UPI003F9C537A
MNTIEEQLWDYIDGNLDAAQAIAIKEKIDTDAEVKFQYEELLRFNNAFDKMEFEEPSMSFTRNVMESIALEPAPIAMKTKVDKKIIYGIGSFFVLSLLMLFGYVLYNSNLTMPGFDQKVSFDFNLNQHITPATIYSFLFADLVIGLIFIDQLLRGRLAQIKKV